LLYEEFLVEKKKGRQSGVYNFWNCFEENLWVGFRV